MIRSGPGGSWTERQQLVAGALALLVGTVCILALVPVGTGGGPSGIAFALIGVALFVAGTLSIGTSDQ